MNIRFNFFSAMAYVLKCVTITFCSVQLSWAAEIVIIVHPSNSVDTLSKSDIGRIFLGKSASFPGGVKATPINTPFFQETREDFDKLYLKRSQAQMKAFWGKAMFSGSGMPPKEVADGLAMLNAVAADPSAIGYLDASLVDASVKKITVK